MTLSKVRVKLESIISIKYRRQSIRNGRKQHVYAYVGDEDTHRTHTTIKHALDVQSPTTSMCDAGRSVAISRHCVAHKDMAHARIIEISRVPVD